MTMGAETILKALKFDRLGAVAESSQELTLPKALELFVYRVVSTLDKVDLNGIVGSPKEKALHSITDPTQKQLLLEVVAITHIIKKIKTKFSDFSKYVDAASYDFAANIESIEKELQQITIDISNTKQEIAEIRKKIEQVQFDSENGLNAIQAAKITLEQNQNELAEKHRKLNKLLDDLNSSNSDLKTLINNNEIAANIVSGSPDGELAAENLIEEMDKVSDSEFNLKSILTKKNLSKNDLLIFFGILNNIIEEIKTYGEKFLEEPKNIQKTLKNTYLDKKEDIAKKIQHLNKLSTNAVIDVAAGVELIDMHSEILTAKQEVLAKQENSIVKSEAENIAQKITQDDFDKICQDVEQLDKDLEELEQGEEQEESFINDDFDECYQVIEQLDKVVDELKQSKEQIAEESNLDLVANNGKVIVDEIPNAKQQATLETVLIKENKSVPDAKLNDHIARLKKKVKENYIEKRSKGFFASLATVAFRDINLTLAKLYVANYFIHKFDHLKNKEPVKAYEEMTNLVIFCEQANTILEELNKNGVLSKTASENGLNLCSGDAPKAGEYKGFEDLIKENQPNLQQGKYTGKTYTVTKSGFEKCFAEIKQDISTHKNALLTSNEEKKVEAVRPNSAY